MTNAFRDILLTLCRREDLTREQAASAFAHLMSGDASDAQIGGVLVGLAAKGSTVDELVGAATVMREHIVPIACEQADVIVDTCGTGGDIRGTFNISTAAAILTAATGVKVVKHGNRSASGNSSSADVLEKLGIGIDLDPPHLRQCLDRVNICFAFAPRHHPAMKFVAAARSALGIPTIFNLLGPLTNPGRARRQLLGVFAPELTERLARALCALGSERAWVVHATDGLDELSTLGPTQVSELRDGKVRTFFIEPRQFGLEPARLTDLQVSGAEQSADAIRALIGGKTGPHRDIAVLNAAAALLVAGRAGDLAAGIGIAQTAIDSGAARATLEAWIDATQN